MESFDLKEHLTPFYDVFPEAPHRPVIGVTANFNDGMATMERAYYQQVADAGGVPQMTVNRFGQGLGVYLSDFQVSPQNTRMLLDILLCAKGLTDKAPYVSGDCRVEAAYYPESRTLIVINNAQEYVETTVSLPDDNWLDVALSPMETKEIIL